MLGSEHAAGLAQAAERGAANAKPLLHFVEPGGLLQTAEAGQDRIEKVQQKQSNVLIEEQLPIARPVTDRANRLEPLQKGLQQLEVLQVLQLLFDDRDSPLARHAASRMPSLPNWRSECSMEEIPADRVPTE